MSIPRFLQASCLWIFISSAGEAQASTPPDDDGACGAPIRSSEDAMAKADFVIEGTIHSILPGANASAPPSLTVERAAIIRQPVVALPSRHVTNLYLGPCFAHGVEVFTGKNGAAMKGKRYRFFGNQHTINPLRFFYMQPADQPLPAAAKGGPPWGPLQSPASVHGQNVERPLGDGWHRATSTEGKFSVDLPAPFHDATSVKDGIAFFELKAIDQHTSLFGISFMPSKSNHLVAANFDREMQKPGAITSVFKGLPAVSKREVGEDGTVIHLKIVRVPGGTFILGVVTLKGQEALAETSRARFYNSLSFQ